jgi:chromate reductase, NAD(P)H dehydrogenase (quinone)
MSAVIVEPASLSIPLLGAGLDEDGMVADPGVSGAILRSLAALHAAVVDGAAEHGPNSPYP